MTPEQDASIRLAGHSPRFAEIDDLERWYFGKQYECGAYKREHEWTKETDSGRYIPLSERKPYDFGLARALVNKPTAFLFDEERFPRLVVEGDEAGQAWLDAIAKAVHLRVNFLEASRIGGRARSVFVYFKLVDGTPILEAHNGKECQPMFARDGQTLTGLKRQYKTSGYELVALGYAGIDPDAEYWFRHDYTPTGETAYQPVKVVPGPYAPVWKVDAERSFEHNLGFVPGVWIANLGRVNGYDGEATYEAAIPILNLCNELLSQGHRAIRFACDPQYALEHEPTVDVADALKNQTKGGLWLMPGTVKLLEMTGNGQVIALEQFGQYQKLTGDATGVPEIDPEKLSGAAQSAEAMRVLYQPWIAFCSVLRVCYGDQGLVPLCRLILKVLKATAGDLLNVVAKDKDGKPVEAGSIKDNAEITLDWGAWFAPTLNDVQTVIGSLGSAVSLGLMSQETAVQQVCDLFGRDAEEELKRILAERAQRDAEMVRQAQALEGDLSAIGHEHDGEDDQEG